MTLLLGKTTGPRSLSATPSRKRKNLKQVGESRKMNTMRTLIHECLRIPWCEKGYQSDNFLWLFPVQAALCGKMHLVSPNCVNVPMLTQPVPFQAPALTDHPICHQHPPLLTITTLPTRGETPVHLAPHIRDFSPGIAKLFSLKLLHIFVFLRYIRTLKTLLQNRMSEWQSTVKLNIHLLSPCSGSC